MMKDKRPKTNELYGANIAQRERQAGCDGRFDPHGSVIDYMTWMVTGYAIENSFTPPFRLRFTDANEQVMRESLVRIKSHEVAEEVLSQAAGGFQFPLTCSLVDKRGRNHKAVVSDQEMKKWTDEYSGVSKHVRFPAVVPNDSSEVFAAIRQMLVAATLEDFDPPFIVEIRDATGELFDNAEIWVDDEGEFRGNTDICNCAHLKFPLTIRLVSRNGRELTTAVQRRC